MSMSWSLTILLKIVLLSSSLYGGETAFPFYQGSFAELQAQARLEGKYYFVHFYTSWCEPCAQMNNTTFADRNVIGLSQQYFYAYQTNAEGAGASIARAYGIMFYPTLMVFSPRGEVLHMSTGYKSPETMVSVLRNSINANPIDVPDSRQYVQNRQRPQNSPNPQTLSNTNYSGRGKNYLNVGLEHNRISGFGIQIGAYRNYQYLQRHKNQVEQYYRSGVMVIENRDAQGTIYKLVLGPFSDKQTAAQVQRQIAGREARSIIVQLSR